MGSSSSTHSDNSDSKQENVSPKEDGLILSKLVVDVHLQKYKVLEKELEETKTNLLKKEFKCRNLQQAIESLENENKRVRSSIEMQHDSLRKYIVLENQLEETKTNLLKKEFECRDLQQFIQSLQNENKRVRSDIEMERAVSLQKYKVLEKQLEETKTNLLNKEFECRNLQQTIQPLENENKQVRSNIEMERANFRRQTDDLVQQNSDLKKQVSLDFKIANTAKAKLQGIIDDLKIVRDFQECKLIAQHQYFRTIDTMLLEERNLKEKATQRIDELQKHHDDSEEKLVNLEQKLKRDGNKIKAQENQITLLNNKLINERNGNQKFKVTEERKYQMIITQLNDSRNKILDLTKQNQQLTSEIEELRAQHQMDLKQMTLEEGKKLKQIERLKDDLLTAEEKITDLENVFEIYQTENLSTQDDVLLKELKTTKILNAYNGIIDLKKRVDQIVQKSEYQFKCDRHKTYENQVKHLKRENEAMVASLNNVRLQNGKIETLEQNYFKLLQENNNKLTSLSKKVQQITTLTLNIHQQFLFDTPAKLLRAVVQHGRALDKIEEINVEKLYQKERALIGEIIKALGDERDFLETMQQSQYAN